MGGNRGNVERERSGRRRWRKWGPYLSEREWGTVREDYSPDGNFWLYTTHETARSRAYRWCEDGLGGFSDERQLLCFAVALWNERDPILKERLFGLTPGEGNHGEDVKECYYYLDATPSHSYLKMLYKYPQSEFPYEELRRRNREAGRQRPEYELLDTGVFNEDRYFDVFIEYAKASPDDILMRITAHNRGPAEAPLHLLPHVWFRNTWSWQHNVPRPSLRLTEDGWIHAEHLELPDCYMCAEGGPEWLFCDNETHARRIYGFEKATGHFKDGIHDYVIAGDRTAVNRLNIGTKAAAHYRFVIPPGGAAVARVRVCNDRINEPFYRFDERLEQRRRDADAFYAELQNGIDDEDQRRIHRQALAGMIWSKQFYHYVVYDWMVGDPAQPPPPPGPRARRNAEWQHLYNQDIISMPDKWEFPWYAAWDLAFHAVSLALVDPEFAKEQLLLLTREWYMHPNGQLPAYEAGFSDVNPPVHAWATWRVYNLDRDQRRGEGDRKFLERMFHRLCMNFLWWVNRKDTRGRNIFQGGFLGLDNIGVFDRGAPLPMGGHLDQADATSWMAMYSLDLMRIALELAKHDRVFEDIASKFFLHFLYIAKAMTNIGEGGIGMWDPEDGFFYDVLNPPNGPMVPMKARSIVGLIPLFATAILEPEALSGLHEFNKCLGWVRDRRPDLAVLVSRYAEPGRGEHRLLSLMREDQIRSVLKRMLDESEFLSPFGVRALSRYHEAHPYVFTYGSERLSVTYEPGESHSDLFGGNSNWRGPIWFPMNYLIIAALREYHRYYGETLRVECPTGSGRLMDLAEVADEIARRLIRIFLRDHQGRRPVFGDYEKMHQDPHFRDYLLYYEYFHADTGRGCGASHQTGWTGLVANLIQGVG